MRRVVIKPELMRWARERADLTEADLSKRFPKLEAWERGEERPTFKQLEAFARAMHAPFGYFFLSEPPDERVPIPDFRTMADRMLERPSPDLLDTIYLCQRRQDWYSEHARLVGEDPRDFVGSVGLEDDVTRVAAGMRGALGFDLEERRRIPTWTEALRRFIDQADALGVLVMVSGVVGTNNRRRLDPEEFRGFALCDDLAPLVFINGADTKAAQMFTLAHELAHLWLGESALSDVGPASAPTHAVEEWCNRVAAELLVPMEVLRSEAPRTPPLDAVGTLARRFKVSSLVVIRRLHDVGLLRRQEMWDAYEDELQRLIRLPKGAGGDFYLTQSARAGKRFTRALIGSTLEGHTLYRDAFQLLGIKKESTFEKWADKSGRSRLMAYLLDSNVFIEAKRRHYGMDFCPAFWDWLIERNRTGDVFSIEQVADELAEGGDDLSDWAAQRGTSFFLPADEAMLAAFPKLTEWVYAQSFRPAAVTSFLQDTDYHLVAYALAHGHVVVTHEIPSDGEKRIKIPNACIGVDVKYTTPFTMLRRERARFVLGQEVA